MSIVSFTVPGDVRGKGRGHKRVSDADLLEAYRRLGSVHLVGASVGITGGSVHERLVRLGAAKPINRISDADREEIRQFYLTQTDDAFDLAALSKKLGRTKQLISRTANALGLTDRRRPMALKQLALHQERVKTTNAYGRAKRGRRDDLGDTHFRSSWEANYARYLNWLQAKGEIDGWEFEPETFWFEKIKRGIRSYLPDFRVTEKGRVYFVEVKGWMDDASKTKLKRMRIYHPTVEVRLVDSKQYHALARTVGRLIPHWEGAA